jgi:hypothetical protein
MSLLFATFRLRCAGTTLRDFLKIFYEADQTLPAYAKRAG